MIILTLVMPFPATVIVTLKKLSVEEKLPLALGVVQVGQLLQLQRTCYQPEDYYCTTFN